MPRPKKKVSFDEPILTELKKIAEKTRKRFSDIMNEAVILGIDGVRRKYADKLTEKTETETENGEEQLSELEKARRERWKKILFDVEHAELYGWRQVE